MQVHQVGIVSSMQKVYVYLVELDSAFHQCWHYQSYQVSDTTLHCSGLTQLEEHYLSLDNWTNGVLIDGWYSVCFQCSYDFSLKNFTLCLLLLNLFSDSHNDDECFCSTCLLLELLHIHHYVNHVSYSNWLACYWIHLVCCCDWESIIKRHRHLSYQKC